MTLARRSVLLGLGLGCASLGAVGGAEASRRVAAMGTTLAITVDAPDRAEALAASERALRAIEAAEDRLSTWRAQSELAGVNRTPVGVAVPLSPELGAELAAAVACARETGGAFDPTVGALVAAWGLRDGGRLPVADEIEAARKASGLDALALGADEAGRPTAARLRPGLAVEEGGFGKGAGLAAALAALAAGSAGSVGSESSAGSESPRGPRGALLDFGGQVAVWGTSASPDGRWRIAIADPARRSRPLVEVAIDRGSLSTSGNGERAVWASGERIGHLLDPRTGRPAPDFGSLTVWAGDPLRADCLSTGLFVLGPTAALEFAATHPGVEVLALVRDAATGRTIARASRGFAGRLAPVAGEDIDIELAGSAAGSGGRSKDNRRGSGPWVAPW